MRDSAYFSINSLRFEHVSVIARFPLSLRLISNRSRCFQSYLLELSITRLYWCVLLLRLWLKERIARGKVIYADQLPNVKLQKMCNSGPIQTRSCTALNYPHHLAICSTIRHKISFIHETRLKLINLETITRRQIIPSSKESINKLY